MSASPFKPRRIRRSPDGKAPVLQSAVARSSPASAATPASACPPSLSPHPPLLPAGRLHKAQGDAAATAGLASPSSPRAAGLRAVLGPPPQRGPSSSPFKNLSSPAASPSKDRFIPSQVNLEMRLLSGAAASPCASPRNGAVAAAGGLSFRSPAGSPAAAVPADEALVNGVLAASPGVAASQMAAAADRGAASVARHQQRQLGRLPAGDLRSYQALLQNELLASPLASPRAAAVSSPLDLGEIDPLIGSGTGPAGSAARDAGGDPEEVPESNDTPRRSKVRVLQFSRRTSGSPAATAESGVPDLASPSSRRHGASSPFQRVPLYSSLLFEEHHHRSVQQRSGAYLSAVPGEVRRHRAIPTKPYKVLAAPDIRDDFYLDVLHWSSQNTLAIGLGPLVYLWNPTTSGSSVLCNVSKAQRRSRGRGGALEDLDREDPSNDIVASLRWSVDGSRLAVGTQSGHVQVWDPVRETMLTELSRHASRVGCMDWDPNGLLATGSRDQRIKLHDLRCPSPAPAGEGDPAGAGGGGARPASEVGVIEGHVQEVCGLRWSIEGRFLASGGNDNYLNIWDGRKIGQLRPRRSAADEGGEHPEQEHEPIWSIAAHQAAVKALAWSPHQPHLLASGGGTADKRLRVWDARTGARIREVDTGSQICGLVWGRNADEIISTHGYSLNQITLWSWPRMEPVVSFTGHTRRVLFVALSADGRNLVTGAGDQTLRFWHMFPAANAQPSVLSAAAQMIR